LRCGNCHSVLLDAWSLAIVSVTNHLATDSMQQRHCPINGRQTWGRDAVRRGDETWPSVCGW